MKLLEKFFAQPMLRNYPAGINAYYKMPFKDKLDNILQIKYDTYKIYNRMTDKCQEEPNIYCKCYSSPEWHASYGPSKKSAEHFDYLYFGQLFFTTQVKLTYILSNWTTTAFAEVIKYDLNNNITYKFCTELFKLGKIHYDNQYDWKSDFCRLLRCNKWVYGGNNNNIPIRYKRNICVEIKNGDTYYSNNNKICTNYSPTDKITEEITGDTNDKIVSEICLYQTTKNGVKYLVNKQINNKKTGEIIRNINYCHKCKNTQHITNETIYCPNGNKINKYCLGCAGDKTKTYRKIEYIDGQNKILKVKYEISSNDTAEFRMDLDKNSKVIVDVSTVRGEEHKFVGYKIGNIPETNQKCVIKLGLLQDSRVSMDGGIQGQKFRCDKARVLAIGAIAEIDGKSMYEMYNAKAVSMHDPNYEYVLGHLVSVSNFEPDLSKVCVPGIHFFVEETTALQYYGNSTVEIGNREMLTKTNFHETIEYIIMLRSAIQFIEYRRMLRKAKKSWEEHMKLISK